MSLKEFHKSLLLASEDLGLKVLSDDYCCQLLAWTYAYGGGLESVTLHEVLNPHIILAQKRLNLYGSEKPNPNLLNKFLEYKKEVAPYIEGYSREYKHPEWALKIFKRYSINPNQIF
jgi:hypothetical protein